MTKENNFVAQLCPKKEMTSLSGLFFSYRKITTKQKPRHPKVGECGPCVELWDFWDGQGFWDHCTVTFSSSFHP